MTRLIAAALEAGAYDAAILPGKDIVLSDQFRNICQNNQCGKFGKCWVCPPSLPEPETVMGKVRSYSQALFYQSVATLENSFDIEGMVDAARNHARLSQRIQTAAPGLLPGGFLHLTCGGCHLCDRCAKEDSLPCRLPEKALSSLEGYCIDVYRTCQHTPLHYINGQNTVTYFGMLLF